MRGVDGCLPPESASCRTKNVHSQTEGLGTETDFGSNSNASPSAPPPTAPAALCSPRPGHRHLAVSGCGHFPPENSEAFLTFSFFFEEGGALRKTTFFPIQVRKYFAENKEKEEGVHSKNIFSVGKIKGKRQVFHPAVTIAQKCRPFSCLLQRTGYRYFNPIIYFERKIVRNVVIHLYFLFPRGQNKYVFFRVIKKTS